MRARFFFTPFIMSLTNAQLDALIHNYSNVIVEGMDIKSLEQFAFDTIKQGLEVYSEKEIVSEIVESYDEDTLEMLLESVKNVRHLSVVPDIEMLPDSS